MSGYSSYFVMVQEKEIVWKSSLSKLHKECRLSRVSVMMLIGGGRLWIEMMETGDTLM